MHALKRNRVWMRLRNWHFAPVRPLTTRGFFVLGMHRSGTSCLTGLLETCGLWLGDVPRASQHNLKGTLEDKWIQRVNSQILRQFGGTWDAPPHHLRWQEVDPLPLCIALRPYQQHNLWALKDPRLVLTLEAWLPLVPQHGMIGTFRHPLAVARSLQARNGMSLDQGLALWTHYNDRLVELQQRFQFPLVSFDVQGAEYLEQFRRLCEVVGLTHDEAAAGRFYDVALASQRSNSTSDLPPGTAKLYEFLLSNQLRLDRTG